ncbi:MAG TPA: SH3-like domain-containing protein [Micropepsaceae bacterium]|nr:SH3-like domain-containing protein [Micropepsaceae bacterium]
MGGDFSPGTRVRVREDFPLGHIRTPVYMRGKEGVVTRRLGRFPNPETLAIGRDGLPRKVLYEVRFRQADLWPDYAGGPADTVDADIYEHWLEQI